MNWCQQTKIKVLKESKQLICRSKKKEKLLMERWSCKHLAKLKISENLPPLLPSFKFLKLRSAVILTSIQMVNAKVLFNFSKEHTH